jgi:hypothetical protein
MWLPHEQNIMINMSCQFLSHVKNWVSVLLQQICTVEGQSRRQWFSFGKIRWYNNCSFGSHCKTRFDLHDFYLCEFQGAVYFVTRQKRRASATCFKRLGTTHVIPFAQWYMYVYCLSGDDEHLQFGCWIQFLFFCGPIVFFANWGDTCPFLQIITPEKLPWGVEQCLPKDVNQWSCLAVFLLLHKHAGKALTLLPFSLCCLWLNRYHVLSCILPALRILWNFSSYPVAREGRKEVMGAEGLSNPWTEIDMNL